MLGTTFFMRGTAWVPNRSWTNFTKSHIKTIMFIIHLTLKLNLTLWTFNYELQESLHCNILCYLFNLWNLICSLDTWQFKNKVNDYLFVICPINGQAYVQLKLYENNLINCQTYGLTLTLVSQKLVSLWVLIRWTE